jgi:hypothetical protein
MKTVLKEIVEEVAKLGTNERFDEETKVWLAKERQQMLEFGMACLTELDMYKNGMNLSVDRAIEEIFKSKFSDNEL